jgi:hypothetical protein
LLHVTPFTIAWTLAAIYAATLLAAAVRIGIRLARSRADRRNDQD